MTPAEWRRIGERLRSAGVVHELRAFDGAAHGFACPQRPATYHAAATEAAWELLVGALRARVEGGAP